ncbi:MAG: succinylglutamate desuccinylase/aspartoacylase family protein [Myxococcota bacterium]
MSGRAIEIAGHAVAPGTRRRLEIPIGRRVTGAEVALPVEVVNGRHDGPRLFVCAAVHGDEINGVEIIRRVLRRRLDRRLRGALIAVPVVNLFGFVGLSRYLPDRRDLNRSFPGSASGSLAGRLAHTFVEEVVGNSTHGIDLHTGAVHRSNLPQIRACLDDEETRRLAHAFGVPVLIDATTRDGSLRQEVYERRMPMLLYEGGEALRFDENAIRAGVRGVISVMRALDMLPESKQPATRAAPFIARGSHWLRAPEAGILRARVALGAAVKPGQRIGVIADPLGASEIPVTARQPGIVIGRSELPLVNEGDALFHVATFDRLAEVQASVGEFEDELSG